MNCAVFASGGGTNFQSLIDRQEAGDLHVTFSLLVSNNRSAGAMERARNHAIPTLHCAPSSFPTEAAYAEKLLVELTSRAVELIVLAGYMKKIPAEIIRRFPHRIVNIHPGLLPAFGGKGLYGRHVHQAVLDYGAKISGVTVHFVDEEYDHGPIILQETVPVLDGDDADRLAERVLQVEHRCYWRAIESVAQGLLTVTGRRVCGALR
jgi:phosphoribosylglycinamide formyltransferase-1